MFSVGDGELLTFSELGRGCFSGLTAVRASFYICGRSLCLLLADPLRVLVDDLVFLSPVGWSFYHVLRLVVYGVRPFLLPFSGPEGGS